MHFKAELICMLALATLLYALPIETRPDTLRIVEHGHKGKICVSRGHPFHICQWWVDKENAPEHEVPKSQKQEGGWYDADDPHSDNLNWPDPPEKYDDSKDAPELGWDWLQGP